MNWQAQSWRSAASAVPTVATSFSRQASVLFVCTECTGCTGCTGSTTLGTACGLYGLSTFTHYELPCAFTPRSSRPFPCPSRWWIPWSPRSWIQVFCMRRSMGWARPPAKPGNHVSHPQATAPRRRSRPTNVALSHICLMSARSASRGTCSPVNEQIIVLNYSHKYNFEYSVNTVDCIIKWCTCVTLNILELFHLLCNECVPSSTKKCVIPALILWDPPSELSPCSLLIIDRHVFWDASWHNLHSKASTRRFHGYIVFNDILYIVFYVFIWLYATKDNSNIICTCTFCQRRINIRSRQQ